MFYIKINILKQTHTYLKLKIYLIQLLEFKREIEDHNY